DISNNKFTAKSLKYLSIFCKRVGVESINLEGNNILTDSNGNEDFLRWIKNIHASIPGLKTLNISNIGISESNLDAVKYLLGQPSLLENIDISKNKIKTSDLLELLSLPAFQANVSLSIETGKNNIRGIKKV